MEIVVRGKVYVSTFEAAKDLGVRVERVREARREGKLDKLGLRQRHCAIPVTIDGVTYPSTLNAAISLGLPYSAVKGGK